MNCFTWTATDPANGGAEFTIKVCAMDTVDAVYFIRNRLAKLKRKDLTNSYGLNTPYPYLLISPKRENTIREKLGHWTTTGLLSAEELTERSRNRLKKLDTKDSRT
jgi:hypothetical protein